MKVAILNCKKSKKNFKCSAFEMYSESHMFTAMARFCHRYYDDYYILSAEYGLLHHTDIIAPYSKVIGGSGYSGVGESNIMTPGELGEWVQLVMSHPLWDEGEYDIELHVGSSYLTPLLPHLPPTVKIHPLPNNTGFVVSHYNYLFEMLSTNQPFDISDINYKRMAQSNKPKEKWYHPIYAPTGMVYNQWDIHHQYNAIQNLDLPTLDMVDNGKKNAVNHHKGWCKRIELLSSLKYNEEKNQWRISK